jgi:squalene synthase HpnC
LAETFANELARWGPASTPTAPGQEAAFAYCRWLATSHYENFPVVTWLLPRSLRPHFYSVYAWCRWADDLGDETGDPERSLALLAWWRDGLEACFAGRATHPVYVALAATIAQFSLPREPFENLLSAFEQDQRVTRYDTFARLRDYCRRSADPVGRLVLHLCRQATDENFRWADSICTGLQLANFWQDVARDHDMGRVYLPEEDCARFDYAPDDLAGRVTNDAFLELMRFEVDRAREFLRPWRARGRPELRPFPWRVQVDLELFARGGERILDRIARIEYRVWQHRPKITRGDIASMALGAVWSACRRSLWG